MPNPTWPGTLPAEWGNDSQRARGDGNVLRTQMDVGPAKLRRRSTADFIGTAFTLVLTTTEKEALDAFYVTTLSKTLPFDWTDYSAVALPTRTFRFVKAPVYAHAGAGLWRASIELEQLP